MGTRFQRHWKTTLLPILLGLLILFLDALFAPDGREKGVLRLVFNLIILGIGTGFWLGFFSQFILPVNQLRDRFNMFFHLISYLIGDHGPILFIENGQIRQQPQSSSNGAGIMVLDTASAAMLRTSHRFTRPVGPGVVFTQPGERIADVVDLRQQRQVIGPRPNGDPFAPPQPNEGPAQYEARMRRKRETRAITRDNFEIIPQIEVIFQLDARPGQGNTEFGYNPDAVQMAILGQVVNADLPLDTPARLIPWNELPAQLAAEVWRDLVSRFTLQQIFPPQPSRHQQVGLQWIVQMIQNRLTQPEVPLLDLDGRDTGEKTVSREFNVLSSRGIRVLEVNILSLRLSPEVERELINRWSAGWLAWARQEREQIERERRNLAEGAREEALRVYAKTSTLYFEALPSSNPHAEEAVNPKDQARSILLRLLRGHLMLIQNRPGLKTMASDEKKQIQDLIEIFETRAP